ncbi:MAG: NAD(P)/FAD-dependent oxidoreductase, partial [Gammaproteobacteria bacterium]|nr:NAD(P)/FAD-dependent oxidoreductase [Gammaproteobacteria bacterium]
MARVVIIGASTGGLPAAYEMREALGKEHKVTVISNTDTFHFVPSNPWVAVGWRTEKDTSFKLEPRLNAKNIDFIPTGAKEIKPAENQVELMDGQVVDYDYLIIATGPKLAFDEVEGLGPEAHTNSICTLDHARDAHSNWETFVANPGPIVVGAAQMASCFGPAYEFAFILDTDLRKRKIRDKVPMTFVTSEPYIGHLGLGGVGDSRGLLEHELRQHHINWIT